MNLSRSLAARALLAIVLMVGFYVLALSVAVALLWVPYAEYQYLDRVDFRVGLACFAFAVAILLSLMPQRDHFEKPGPELSPSTAPELFALIDHVAEATSQPRPSEVYLLNEVNAWVSQRGGTMGFGSRRVMGVGLPLVNSLTRAELQAVIAHEFGHYVGGDVGLGPWIYKTRAAIARTMAAFDESYLQWIFKAYGTMFMRLTMAVSRQQEFLADETAARISGSAPMVSALQKVAMLAPAYSVYLQHEVLPVLRFGFLPPLAEGFQRFIASPETRTAFDRMTREQTTGDVAGKFDTHPPLNERVSALERLQVARIANTVERSLPILKDPETHARLLLEYSAGADSLQRLRAIQWDDVADSIYGKEWHRLADTFAAPLGAITVGNLPAGKKAYKELGAALKDNGRTIVDGDARLGRAMEVVTAALGSALLRAGWKLETGPGRPLELKNGGASVIPREVVGRLIENAEYYAEWKAKSDAMGISDIPLANPAPSTT